MKAVAIAKPDVIVHEMTSLSAVTDLRKDNLLAAAKQANTPRVLAQSFCGWPYARSGGPVKSEDDPLDPEPPQELRRSLTAIRYLENALTA